MKPNRSAQAGGDDSKTLIDRQRQDDPDNRALDLFGAAGDQLYATAPGTKALPFGGATTTQGCEDWALSQNDPNWFDWRWTGTTCELRQG